MNHRTLIVAAASILAIAGTSQAALFSFASDNNSNNFTIGGSAGAGSSFTITNPVTSNYNLLIDDDNGPLATVSIAASLSVNFTATFIQSNSLGGGLFLHSYQLAGSFTFTDARAGFPATPLLTGTINNATGGVFSALGFQNSWTSTASATGNDNIGQITYTFSPALITALGGTTIAANNFKIAGTNSTVGDDFTFNFTALGAGAPSTGVALVNGVPNAAWGAEGSFSGGTVPAPASAALIGLGGLIAGRRRRA